MFILQALESLASRSGQDWEKRKTKHYVSGTNIMLQSITYLKLKILLPLKVIKKVHQDRWFNFSSAILKLDMIDCWSPVVPLADNLIDWVLGYTLLDKARAGFRAPQQNPSELS